MKMSQLSFCAPGKTSHKMLKIVREICVQVMENISETLFKNFGVTSSIGSHSIWYFQVGIGKRATHLYSTY